MSENTLWIVITVVGAAGALLIGLSLRKVMKDVSHVCGSFLPPQLRFRYTAGDVKQLMEKLDACSMTRRFDQFSLLMLAMMAEMLLVLMAAAHNIAAPGWKQNVMFIFSGVVWLFGTLETLLVKKCPGISSVLSLIKWAAFALWTLCMFVFLFLTSTTY